MTADDTRDADARRAAVDPRKSFIVQAPAGSGKTSLLTLRYLRLLATVDSPEEIVAITFTRKAASEMRHRILDALDEAARPLEPGAPPHLQERHALAAAALARSRTRGWDLERNTARLHVQTIDGLNHWLAQRLPLAARIGLAADVVDDARPLYREAARRLPSKRSGLSAAGSRARSRSEWGNSLFTCDGSLDDTRSPPGVVSGCYSGKLAPFRTHEKKKRTPPSWKNHGARPPGPAILKSGC